MDTTASGDGRYERAREALAAYESVSHPDTLEGEEAAHGLAVALRTLIEAGPEEDQYAKLAEAITNGIIKGFENAEDRFAGLIESAIWNGLGRIAG